ncbi:hypothetical protein [Aurantimicrobium photophilum]|uniref:hypothetical protein n=1 Tax=Aurantimicrobium photophilum TaxID=1987356 RepID=UPI0013A5BBBA|nr:hypothetical protein [Aurantimicrobium photophilum]
MSSTSRKITALVRWGISAWVLAAIVTQIWSEVANDAFYLRSTSATSPSSPA